MEHSTTKSCESTALSTEALQREERGGEKPCTCKPHCQYHSLVTRVSRRTPWAGARWYRWYRLSPST
eukprot:2244224-Rhodomonas_salina.1